MPILVIFFSAFLVAYFSTPLFKKIAIKFGILDMPGLRKIHQQPTPLLGGVAIFCGLLAGLLFDLAAFNLFLGILIGASVILLIGLIDDARGLSAQIRLLGQTLAALVVISFGIRLTFLPTSLWGDIAEIVLTLIWIVGVTNAFNYLDGVDGLAAGIAAISAFFFSLISYLSNYQAFSLMAFTLMASCLGYLPHNFKKQKIFLGDAGSTMIGFILASIAVQGDWAEDSIVRLAVPVLILTVPIFDMIFTTIMRIREGKVSTIVEWLKYGGTDHFHHRLMSLGLFQTEAMLFICFVSISFGINAIMVSNEKAIVGILSILQALIIFFGIAVLMLIGKRRSKN